MMLHHSNSIALAITLVVQYAIGQVFTGPHDPRLKTAWTLDVPCNGVSTTVDGRLFLVLARVAGSKGPAVVEYNQTTDEMTAYPNEEWNSYQEGDNPSTKFVRINAQRLGPDGYPYIVDVGSPAFGEPVILPEGPKLIQIDVSKKEVSISRVYSMGNVTRSNSLLDDVRFNPTTGTAYLSNAGSPGLIVLGLASGISRRGIEAASPPTENSDTSTPISWKYHQTARSSTSHQQTAASGDWRLNWLEQAF